MIARNPFAIGFVMAAAGFGVAADYAVQAQKAGSYPGAYAVSDYIGSYAARFNAQTTTIDKTRRQVAEARSHLPDAPKGWTRADWDIKAIDMEALTKGMHMIERMKFKEERGKSMKAAKTDIYDYRKGADWVRLYARHDPEMGLSETAVSGWLTGTFHPIEERMYEPYDVFQGVPFLMVLDREQPALAPGETPEILLLEAAIGPDMKIAVAAQAAPDTVAQLLAGIDFENLNQMLDQPITLVGNDAPELSEGEKRALGGLHALARNAGKVPQAYSTAALQQVQAENLAAKVAVQDAGLVQVETTDTPAKPGRLKLSGGRSCLGETSKLCN